MSPSPNPATPSVNLYEAIGLDPQDSTELIQEKLHDLKAGWMSKASRSGGQGDKAREQIAFIAEAELAFDDEDTREHYDLALRRNPAPKTADATIDWLTRSWNYYFVRDGGAAGVAARYAREQDSKNALAFVVSAWIKLLDGADGQKQAKEYADEAFVLDELGQDTADVHHVRGVVYYLLHDLDRAMKSFDRALAAASDGEKPEILMRKAWVYEGLTEYQEMYESCVTALSIDVPVTTYTQTNLVETLTRAIVRLDEQRNSPAGSIAAYRARRTRIEASDILAGSKASILAYLDILDEIAEKTKDVEDQIDSKNRRLKSAELVQPVGGSKPPVPAVGLVIAILNVFLLPAWGAIPGGGFVLIPILFILGFGGWTIYRFVQRSNWATSQGEFEQQQALAARLRVEIADLEASKSDIEVLRKKLPAGVAFWASSVKEV
jgi:tetratricopeptide (TPR) repeat protein